METVNVKPGAAGVVVVLVVLLVAVGGRTVVVVVVGGGWVVVVTVTKLLFGTARGWAPPLHEARRGAANTAGTTHR